jgi:hypothetical protein
VRRRLLTGLLLVLALVHAAGGSGLPPAQKALLLLKVLTYDRNLVARAGAGVRIAVVFRPGHGASQAERDALLPALEQTARRAVVAGLPVSAVAVPFRDAESLAARLAELHAAALYACAGLEDVAREIARAARERGVPSVAGARDPVLQGLAVALVDRGDRAGVVVNLRAAAAQGADLDAALLELAERVEGVPWLP